MKIRLPVILSVLLIFQILSCSKKQPEESEVLARINNFNLTLHEFQYKLADELEMERDFKLTKKAKEDFLEDMIRKELLIQEAKRLNLDKEENFIRAIEKYWESTLIKDLIQKKGDEISRRITVSQEEIDQHYNLLKSETDNIPPSEVMETELKRELAEMKKTEELRSWIESLRDRADIEINRELLYQD